MNIRAALESELSVVKKIIDSADEMDTDEDTFSLEYLKRILDSGVLLVAIENELVGVCFGKYHSQEAWADLLGVVVHKEHRRKGVASRLIESFEEIVQAKGASSIDLYSNPETQEVFSKQGFIQGRSYVAMRKKLT